MTNSCMFCGGIDQHDEHCPAVIRGGLAAKSWYKGHKAGREGVSLSVEQKHNPIYMLGYNKGLGNEQPKRESVSTEE